MATPSEPIGQHDLADVDLTLEERELFDGPSLWDRFEPNLVSERDAYGTVVFMVTAVAHGALLGYAFAPPIPADHHMEAWRMTAGILGFPFLFSLFFYQRFVGLMTALAMAVAVMTPTDMVVFDLDKWRTPAKILAMNWAWLNTRTFPLWVMVYGGLWLPITGIMGLFRRPSRRILDARAKLRWERLWIPEIRRREKLRIAVQQHIGEPSNNKPQSSHGNQMHQRTTYKPNQP
ncbi:MAG: hypothetical protein H7338_20805 [Candidatus Sericytochromatia bacterium]|nr:hypothetical protein [Candidatus Sericytochromatia bacterium]